MEMALLRIAGRQVTALRRNYLIRPPHQERREVAEYFNVVDKLKYQMEENGQIVQSQDTLIAHIDTLLDVYCSIIHVD